MKHSRYKRIATTALISFLMAMNTLPVQVRADEELPQEEITEQTNVESETLTEEVPSEEYTTEPVDEQTVEVEAEPAEEVPEVVEEPTAEPVEEPAAEPIVEPVEESAEENEEPVENAFGKADYPGEIIVESEDNQHYYVDLDGFTVTVTTQPGAFEEKAVLSTSVLENDSEEYQSAEEALKESEQAYDGMLAFDIHFENAEGVEIEPNGKVTVKFTAKAEVLSDIAPDTVDASSIQILHIVETPEEESAAVAEVVADNSANTPDVNVVISDNTVEKVSANFDVESFSTFALTWKDAEDNNQEATIHYGTGSIAEGTWEEFAEGELTPILDTSTGNVSLENTFSNYSCYGAIYKATEESVPAEIEMIIHEVDGIWNVTKRVSTTEGEVSGVEEPIANGSDIYVVYGAKQSPTPTPEGDKDKGPTTNKNIDINDDDTATITLDITAPVFTSTEPDSANVIVVLDNTTSMSYGMTSESTAPSVAENRMEAARSALNILVNNLDMDKNNINFALALFNLNGSTHSWGTDGSWETDADTILEYVNDNRSYAQGGLNYTTSTSGTNWEIGLRQGQGLLTEIESDDEMKKNKTFVIFVTDGMPNRWVGYPYGNNDFSHNTEAVTNATDEAQNIATRATLYSVFCSQNPTGEGYLEDLVSAAGSETMISAHSKEALENAFKVIATEITTQLGSSETTLDDGIPKLASMSATISGSAGGYEYYKATLSDGQTIDDLDDSDFTPWSDAPGASYSEDNGVTWDLSDIEMLEENVVYRIRFKVWPSQEAYDIIANLNNGVVKYSDLDQSIREQINANPDGSGPYSLKTNTHLKQTYTFNGATHTDDVTYEEKAMPLVSHEMNVLKEWDDDINPRNRTDKVEFYLLVDGKYYQNDGTFKDSKDNAYKLVTEKDEWSDSVKIAPGFMETIDGKLTLLETGHKYMLEEVPSTDPDYEGYSQEFTTQTVRPMVIDGDLTYLVLIDDDNPKPEGADTLVLDEETYYIQEIQDGANGTLTGTNHKTAELDITKAVDGSLTEKTEDELSEETFTYEVTFVVPEGGDVTGINYWIYEEGEGEGTWPLPEYDTGNPGAGYQPFDYTNEDTFTGEKTTIGATTSPVKATVTITRNQIVRFTNLPTGTTYTIVETKANDDALNTQGYTVSSVKSTNGTVSKTTIDNDTITGTITESNTRYYNQFTNKLSAVDQELKVKKEAVGYEIGDDDEYEFTISADEGVPLPEKTTVKINTNDNPDLTASFGDVRFTAAGEYKYTVTETHAGEVVDGIIYGGPQTITVEVVQNDDGTLTVESVDPETAVVTITNTREVGDLDVTKTVVSDASADKTKDFIFRVTLSDTTITKTYGDVAFEDGVATFTLKDGETKAITGLPTGITYTVEENTESGFVTTKTGETGSISTTKATAAFTNTRETGDLELSKKLVSEREADKDQVFTFTVTLDDTTISKKYGDMTFANGVATVELKGGETATATGLPTEVGYTITEKDAPGFKVTKTGDEGTISTTKSTVEFTNTREVGDLELSKELISDRTADKNQVFTFTVTLDDTTISKTYGDMTFANGVATVELKGGESATATGLPTDVEYKITEAEAEGFELTGTTGDTGTISTTKTTATFTNTRDTGDLTVKKTVASDTKEDETKDFNFIVTLSDTGINGTYGDMEFTEGVAEFTLKHNESKTAEGLPTEINYTVEEEADDRFVTTMTGETGSIVKDEEMVAEFTNIFIDIKVKKVDDKNNVVKGAVLAVKDEEGNIVDQWTTDGTIHQIENLLPDTKYTLTELKVPEGYEKSPDITFMTDSSGKAQALQMVDKKKVIPDTSDHDRTPGWTISMIMSLLMAGLAFATRKKYGHIN